VPSFERGENGRILHTVAPVLRDCPSVMGDLEMQGSLSSGEVAALTRVVKMHEEMLGRAKRAIDCWSLAGRHLRVVKDVRAMIAKLAWEEVWRWAHRHAKPMGVEKIRE
jgi:hypothetical protein